METTTPRVVGQLLQDDGRSRFDVYQNPESNTFFCYRDDGTEVFLPISSQDGNKYMLFKQLSPEKLQVSFTTIDNFSVATPSFTSRNVRLQHATRRANQ